MTRDGWGKNMLPDLLRLLRLLPLPLGTRGHILPWVRLVGRPPAIEGDELSLVYHGLANGTCGVVRSRLHPLWSTDNYAQHTTC